MLTTRPAVLTELLMRRIVGALPVSGCLSRVIETVALHALPAVVAAGLPESATFRSFALAAGAETKAARTAKTISLRMPPPSVCRTYTGQLGQVPHDAESGQRASTATRRPCSAISTEAALFA